MMEIILSWAIFALILLSLWHLIWESILAPSFRLEERLELFCLRDEVRTSMIKDNTENEESLELLQETINNAIRVMPSFTVSDFCRFKKAFASDEELQKRIAPLIKMVFGASNQNIRRMANQISNSTRRALVINSGGWLIFVVPIALIIVMWSQVKRTCQNLLAASSSDMPESFCLVMR